MLKSKKITHKPAKRMRKDNLKTDTATKPKTKQRKTFKQAYVEARDKVWAKKNARLKLHHSFKRSYREDYLRPLNVPGMVSHAMSTLKIIFRNWRLFLPLIAFIVIVNIELVGLMNEHTYESVQETIESSYDSIQQGELGRVAEAGLLIVSTVTTGGLTSGMTEVQQIIAAILLLLIWLSTIYFLRQLLAGNRPRFRDGLYNAFTPLVSTFCVLALIVFHAIPIMLFTVVFSSAVATGFLNQPLYAFLFWVFGGLLILLSCYLLPGSILALVAVTVPGMYPMVAVNATTDLIQGRRTAFIIRMFFGLLFIAVMWVIIMLPITWLDLFLKDHIDGLAGIPIVPFFLQIMTTFSLIYATSYIYLFYRRMLDDPN